jgi:hypothetical protein
MEQRISSKQEREEDERKDEIKHDHNYHLHQEEVPVLIVSNEQREQGGANSRSQKRSTRRSA